MDMKTPSGDRATGSIPVVSSRTWHSARMSGHTLNVEQTDGGDFGVQFWIGAPGVVGSVLLERTQIDELITDLLRRRTLVATRRAGRSDR